MGRHIKKGSERVMRELGRIIHPHSHLIILSKCSYLSSSYLSSLPKDLGDHLVEIADNLEHGVVREELGGELTLQRG